MQTEKPKKEKYGKPNGTIYVILQEGLHGTSKKGNTKTFSVYNTTLKDFEEFFKSKIKEEHSKNKGS